MHPPVWVGRHVFATHFLYFTSVVYACDVVEMADVFVAFSAVWENYFFNSFKSGMLSLEKAVGFMDW